MNASGSASIQGDARPGCAGPLGPGGRGAGSSRTGSLMRARWRFIAATFTAAAVTASAFVAPAGSVVPGASATAAAPTPRAGAVALTVGTFNVNKGSSGLGIGGDRMNRIASEIRRSGFDVVGLQEIATTMRNSLAPRLRPEYSYSLVGDAKGRNTTGGQIFYRSDVLFPGSIGGTIALPTYQGPGRFGLYQDFYHRASGAHFLFVSVHLSNLDGRAASNIRSQQSHHLLAGIAAVNGAGLPVVIGGDMNSNHARKYVYDAPRQAFQSAGFSEVYDRPATKVNAKLNSFNHLAVVPLWRGYRPDQIYVSGNIGVQYVETMARLVNKKVKVKKKGKRVIKKVKRYRTPFVSDHNAIRAIVVVPGQ